MSNVGIPIPVSTAQSIQRAVKSVINPKSGYSVLSAESKRLTEQCLLTSYLSDFQLYGQQKTYDRFVILDGVPDKITSILLVNRGNFLVNNLTSAQFALLVPKLRIYKRIYETLDYNAQPVEIELSFDDSLTKDIIDSILRDRAGRGGGVGVKELSLTNRGDNQANTIVATEANLKIFAQSLDDLALDQGRFTTPVSILDLVNYTNVKDSTTSAIPKAYSPNYCEIKIIVGWEVPPCAVDADIFPLQVRQALTSATSTYILTLRQHQLEFRDNGSIDLSIDYIARAEALGSTIAADVLSSIKREILEKTKIVEEIDVKIKQLKPEQDELIKAEQKKREEISKSINSIRSDVYRSFVEKLLDRNKVYYAEFSLEELDNWSREESKGDLVKAAEYRRNVFRGSYNPVLGTTNSQARLTPKSGADIANTTEMLSGLIRKRAESIAEETANLSNAKEKAVATRSATKDGKFIVNYVYAGDLIETALEVAYGEKRPRDLFYFTGPVYFTNPFTNVIDTINIADVPITLNKFCAWFIDNVISGERTSYPIRLFLSQMMTGLIQPALQSSCVDKTFDLGNTNIRTIFLTAPRMQDGTERLSGLLPEDFGRMRIFVNELDNKVETLAEAGSRCESKSAEDLFNYVIICGTAPGFIEMDTPDEARDAKYGITWMRWGSDHGMIKDMKFTTQDIEHQQESAIISNLQSASTQIDVLRRNYNVQVRMIGNSFFTPGDIIYLDPSAFVVKYGNEHIPRKLGLSGYYMTIEVSSVIRPGKFETTLQLVKSGGFKNK